MIKMEYLLPVIAILGILATLLSPFLRPAYRRYKSRPLSDCRIEQEIAKIVKKTGKYEFNDLDLGYLANELKIKFKDRLPEAFRSEHPDDRKAALFRFLHCRKGWVSGQKQFGTSLYTYKVPYRYRRKSP